MADQTNDDLTESKASEDGAVGVVSPDEVLAGGSRTMRRRNVRPSR